MSQPKISQFMPHSDLSPKVWKNGKIIPEVRNVLLAIAQEFLNYLDINLDVIDITFTGSYANYNYTPYSDIDLHLIIDLNTVENETIETLIKRFMLAKKDLFNNRYSIEVNGIDVELYPQDASEPHVSSGVFSLDDNEWIIKPKKFLTSPNVQKTNKKYKMLTHVIDEILKHGTLQEVEALIEKIKNMRKAGLEKSGEMSIENITYKLLRAEGGLQNLFNKKYELYGDSLSL
jgi:predicted nucleotidyltransferase